MFEYEVGDTIRYRTFLGAEKEGVVTAKFEEPHARIGFDLVTPEGKEYWGYNDQIISVKPQVRS